MPEVQDIKHTGPVLKHKQSKTEFLPRLSSRICVAGPSGVGKGVLVMQLLTNPEFYRGCFETITSARVQRWTPTSWGSRPTVRES